MNSPCTDKCWTPVACPTCGNILPPRGRSAPMEMHVGDCCHEAQHTRANTRHLWSEHDSDRAYNDPEGWAAHIVSCGRCEP